MARDGWITSTADGWPRRWHLLVHDGNPNGLVKVTFHGSRWGSWWLLNGFGMVNFMVHDG